MMSVVRVFGIVVLALGFAGSAQADLVGDLITVEFEGNDCSGVFGSGFENCDVGGALEPAVGISPIIAKYEVDESKWEINSAFPTVDGDEEFSFGTGASGNWTYTPGPGDPSVLYWVAKGGNIGFNLFWAVPDDSVAACTVAYSAGCLSLAIPQTMGPWSVPSGSLSHLSFYDGGTTVPEPSTLLLLGTGLAMVGLRRRRKQ